MTLVFDNVSKRISIASVIPYISSNGYFFKAFRLISQPFDSLVILSSCTFGLLSL